MVRIRCFLSLAVAAGLCAGLAGCATPAPETGFPEIAFSHIPPIRLDVARIEVVQAYRAPGVRPNVEHLFPAVPAMVAERWAHQRLKAVGKSGVARVTVVDAAVIEVPLKRTTGLKGAFTTDQAERYEAVIEVKIDIVAAGGRERATVSARAARSRTAAENITVRGRQKLWFELTGALANDLNASLERQIRANFARWLR